MSRRTFKVGGAVVPFLVILLFGAALTACNKQSAPTGTPVDSSAGSPDSQAAALKAREDELAQREAAVAEKEREMAVAQREATVAAQEQELARQKQEAEAAAADKARSATAKPAAAKQVAKKPEAVAKSATGGSSDSPPPPKAFERVEVPSGTQMTVALASDLSSKTAKAGDPFEATLASNLTIGGRLAVPIGARVTGSVTDVISGSHSIGAVPVLGLKFNQIELEDGQVIPITGELMEQGPSEKVRDTAKILGGAAAGAVLGHQVKTNNSGKVIGGLLGGAIGAVAAKKTGTEVQLASGSTVTLTTGEPFSVNVPVTAQKQ